MGIHQAGILETLSRSVMPTNVKTSLKSTEKDKKEKQTLSSSH